MKIYIILALCVFLCSCVEKHYTIIEKMDRDTSISVKTSRGNPSTLKIKITGVANDTFTVNKLDIPGGKIDTVWISDWYNKIYIINYKKKKATIGKIKVESSLY